MLGHEGEGVALGGPGRFLRKVLDSIRFEPRLGIRVGPVQKDENVDPEGDAARLCAGPALHLRRKLFLRLSLPLPLFPQIFGEIPDSRTLGAGGNHREDPSRCAARLRRPRAPLPRRGGGTPRGGSPRGRAPLGAPPRPPAAPRGAATSGRRRTRAPPPTRRES